MEHGRYVEAKPKGKDGFKFRARNELTTKRKNRKRNAERCRFGELHELMTREARENDFSILGRHELLFPFLVLTLFFSQLSSLFSKDISRLIHPVLMANRFLIRLPFKPRSTYLVNLSTL